MRILSALPSIVAITSFLLTIEPSFFLIVNLILVSSNLNFCFANYNTETTSCLLEINLTFISFLFLTRLEVISPDG